MMMIIYLQQDDEHHTESRHMRYKALARHTGLRVAQLVLGTGMFGTKWGHGANPKDSRSIFDAYLAAGGNLVDTSDSYQFGESECLLGEFIKPVRDDLIVATKYTQSEVSAIPLGFPHDMLAILAYQDRIAGGRRASLDLPAQAVR
jgi:aryl-alcohol dehydrogenase-like predicted oxidoreductase